jgi:hypothetical protein
MKHHVSPEDDQFRNAFEALQVEPAAFDHAAHVLFSPAARQAFVEPNIQSIPP